MLWKCHAVLNCLRGYGETNARNRDLLKEAERRGLKIVDTVEALIHEYERARRARRGTLPARPLPR